MKSVGYDCAHYVIFSILLLPPISLSFKHSSHRLALKYVSLALSAKYVYHAASLSRNFEIKLSRIKLDLSLSG
jgi:hypothetical protein